MNKYESMTWEELRELPSEEFYKIPKTYLDQAVTEYYERIANKRNAKKISREVSNIVMEIKLNYHTYNPNWCDLTKEEYYKSLNEYTIKNNEYFYKLYKQRLKKYGIDIIFIKL